MQSESVNEDIVTTRQCGVVRCGFAPAGIVTTEDVAAAFGLRAEASAYREISLREALTAIVRILHKDMAYDAEIMPLAKAERLAHGFLTQFGAGARVFTNNWCPATDATFDEGVVVLGEYRSGCLWVEDED